MTEFDNSEELIMKEEPCESVVRWLHDCENSNENEFRMKLNENECVVYDVVWAPGASYHTPTCEFYLFGINKIYYLNIYKLQLVLLENI